MLWLNALQFVVDRHELCEADVEIDYGECVPEAASHDPNILPHLYDQDGINHVPIGGS